MRWYIPVAIAIVIVIIVTITISLQQPSTPEVTKKLVISNESVAQAIGTRVTVTDTYFYPATYTITPNNALVLLFTSPGRERTLSIPGLGATVTVPADTDTPYTTPKLVSGSFIVYCTAGCEPSTPPMTVTIQ